MCECESTSHDPRSPTRSSSARGDDKFGEDLCAWIKLEPGESAADEEIRGFCCGQIAHYKVPRHIRFVQGSPMGGLWRGTEPPDAKKSWSRSFALQYKSLEYKRR
jgi:acyl-CoA synthetase (AMP-forming)/AMP-acid ligase II